MIYTGYIPLANILKSNPKRSFSSVASQSSFASSRQASASDLLPSPAALATRAQGEGSPPRAAAAPSQRRPLLHHRYQSSRLARHLVASSSCSSPTRDSRRVLGVGPGTPLPGLVALPTRRQAGIGHSTSNAPPPAPVRRRQVQHVALSVSCVCRGDRVVPRSVETAGVSAPSRAGQTLSNEGPEGLPHSTRPAPAPKPPAPPAGQLVHRDAAG